MLPTSSHLKWVGLEMCLVVWASYMESGHETQGEEIKIRTWTKMDKNWPLQGACSFIVTGGN